MLFKRKLFWAVLAMMLPAVVFAQSHTVSGTLTDGGTGETLIGATVMDVRSGKGTVTNQYGHYSLTLKQDTVELRFSFVGYSRVDTTLWLGSNKNINLALQTNVQLREVVVRAEKVGSVASSQMSAIEVPVEQIKAVPVLFGEADVLKAIQLLPGVQSGSEGMSGMYVRGGGPDENLFLLDGVPLYNVNHMGGFFSAFNSDAIKNVTLYKGSFPAHFGGRLSSVLDITTNNGNSREYHGEATIGAISAKLTVEGPIVKDKTTFSVSARRTYADALIQPFIGLIGLSEGVSTSAGYYFYDLNAKVTHKFSDRSRLFVSHYMGDDKVYFKVKTREGILGWYENFREHIKMGYNWGNMVSSARWNYEVNSKLFMNVTGAFTRYRNDISVGAEEEYWGSGGDQMSTLDMSYNSGIRDLTAKVDFDYAPHSDHAVRFGASLVSHLFTPEILGMRSVESGTELDVPGGTTVTTIDTTLGESKLRANEMSMYVEDDWTIGDMLKLNAGVNLTGFAVQQKFYPSLQPRLSGRVLLNDNLSFKAGYSYMTQYMHLLSNSNISLPTDLWVPVTARILPMYSNQVAAGVFYTLKDWVELSVEGYYKKMNNLLEYKDGASFWSSSTSWEDKVLMGDGWSYGVEFLAQRTMGKFTGWVGYTWSKTMRQFDREGMMLNNGEPFPAKYDRRHDVSIVAMYKPNKNFDVSVSWVYSTGNCATLAMQEYEDLEGESSPYSWYDAVGYIDHRNNFRMPAYHRMDIGANFHKELKRGTRTWSVSVYNVYNRQNPYIVYESSNYHYTVGNTTYSNALVQLSIFPIIPSVSYSFKF